MIEQIRENSSQVLERLKELKFFDIVADIRHKGLLTEIDLEKNGKSIEMLKDGERNYYDESIIENGCLSKILGNILMFIPPLAIKQKDLDRIIDVQFKIIEMINMRIPGSLLF